MAGERLKYWSSQQLDGQNRKAVEDVRQHGLHVVHVLAGDSQGWSYSVGLPDSYGHPEIIIIGMDHETAHAAITELGKRVAAGERYVDGVRVKGVLSDDLVMRTVDERWHGYFIDWAKWFMGTDDVPLMQAVYPDDSNRFAWEEGFDAEWRPAQPLLFAHELESNVEDEFLEEQELRVEEDQEWPFPISGDTRVFTTLGIEEGSDLIASVVRDAADDWQFLGFEESTEEDIAEISLRSIVRLDPSLREVAELPPRHRATRETFMDPWVIESDD